MKFSLRDILQLLDNSGKLFDKKKKKFSPFLQIHDSMEAAIQFN